MGWRRRAARAQGQREPDGRGAQGARQALPRYAATLRGVTGEPGRREVSAEDGAVRTARSPLAAGLSTHAGWLGGHAERRRAPGRGGGACRATDGAAGGAGVEQGAAQRSRLCLPAASEGLSSRGRPRAL